MLAFHNYIGKTASEMKMILKSRQNDCQDGLVSYKDGENSS